MENFHFQFSAITAQRTGGGTGLMFALAARELEDAKSKDKAAKVLASFLGKLRERLPSTAEFAVAFGELQHTEENAKQRSLVKYLLARVDQHERKVDAMDYEKMSIEHIASQSPKAGEPPVPVNVGELGNLLVVPEALNSQVLANKPFLKKKAAYKKHRVPLDQILAVATSWGEAEIRARTKALASLVQEKVFRV